MDLILRIEIKVCNFNETGLFVSSKDRRANFQA
jgi:hypothetical protein